MKFYDLPAQLEGDCNLSAHSTHISNAISELLLDLCGVHRHTSVVRLNSISAPHNHEPFSLLGNHFVQLEPTRQKRGSLFFREMQTCNTITEQCFIFLYVYLRWPVSANLFSLLVIVMTVCNVSCSLRMIS